MTEIKANEFSNIKYKNNYFPKDRYWIVRINSVPQLEKNHEQTKWWERNENERSTASKIISSDRQRIEKKITNHSHNQKK